MARSTRGRCRAKVGLGFTVRWLDSQDSLLFGIGGHCRVRGQEVGTLSLSIAFAFDLDLKGVVGQTVQSALSKNGIIEQRNPLIDVSIGGEDGGGTSVAFDDDFVDVVGLCGIEPTQSEVVEDE